LPISASVNSLGNELRIAPNSSDCLVGLQENRLVYVATSIYEPVRPIDHLLPEYVPLNRLPVAAVIHDLVPHLFADLYGYSPFDRRLTLARESLFRGSDAFLCNSKNTARDTVACLGANVQNVFVVGTGVDPSFVRVQPNIEILKRLGIERPFIMTVGRSDPRKQTSRLIEVYSRLSRELRSSHSLVVACRTDDEIVRSWKMTAAECGLLPEQLIITGLLSDRELQMLYSTTSLFVEPSLYEGFGLPAAEAAACGAVTLTSSASSLPEVLDDPEALFDATNLDQWIQQIEIALTDTGFRTARIQRNLDITNRHNWKSVARSAVSIFEGIARSPSSVSS
jgi:glycosyltransferase involved in cell wall biosynthesis